MPERGSRDDKKLISYATESPGDLTKDDIAGDLEWPLKVISTAVISNLFSDKKNYLEGQSRSLSMAQSNRPQIMYLSISGL